MEEIKTTQTIVEETKPRKIRKDEVGRGPLFGRVYTAAVILPKDHSFDHSKMKDSKQFHSKKKMNDVAEYIKSNALSWSIHYEDEKTIDQINILQATQKSMHACIKEILQNSKNEYNKTNTRLLVDGNYFNSFTSFNKKNKIIESYDHICVEGGDNKFSVIAAASILAKVARDQYIEELCEKYPTLVEYYSIDTNKGYGAKKHLDGIKKYGITEWHRKSFAPCRNNGKTKKEDFECVEIVEEDDDEKND
jgi:ribonuclease HII